MIYHIFISHAWHRNEHYDKVIEWLDDSSLFYTNYSVTEKNPLHSKDNEDLKKDLTNQIRPSSCVIILGGMYSAYSDWIEYELDEAVRMNKYIIGVKPWGQERIPEIIQNNADVIVGWNSDSIINAIQNS